ncbi:MAG: NAD-dependent epimerase/dehydratase family protein, partial [Solirubrobacterales bacterium]
MASCLVTGGQGFIGSALARALLERGDRVAVLDLPEPPFEGLEAQGIAGEVELFEGDLADPGEVTRAIEGQERVFHLGAVTLVGPAAADPVATYRTNVEGTWTLLEGLRSTAIEALVVASSDKAYGPSAELPYREVQPLRPGSPYEGSKAACDEVARSYGAIAGIPVAVTRLANVYGGGDLNFSRLVPELLAAVVNDRPPRIRSDGSPERDFLHVSDALEGYLAMADLVAGGSGHGEAFNLGTGTAVAVGRVIEVVDHLSVGKLRPVIEEEEGAAGEIDRQFVDSTKVRGATGWQATVDLEEGLEETLGWYTERPALCP